MVTPPVVHRIPGPAIHLLSPSLLSALPTKDAQPRTQHPSPHTLHATKKRSIDIRILSVSSITHGGRRYYNRNNNKHVESVAGAVGFPFGHVSSAVPGRDAPNAKRKSPRPHEASTKPLPFPEPTRPSGPSLPFRRSRTSRPALWNPPSWKLLKINYFLKKFQ